MHLLPSSSPHLLPTGVLSKEYMVDSSRPRDVFTNTTKFSRKRGCWWPTSSYKNFILR